jgi:hypothetical protein
MPALTTNQLRNVLGEYIEPGGSFLASINQVLSRIYSTGTYRDLTVQYSLPVVNSHVTLPDDADAILHTLVNGSPVPARALWHDFKSVGSSYDTGDLSWGLIDAGYWPTLRQLPEAGVSSLYVTPAASDHRYEPWNPGTDGSSITVVASNGEKVFHSSSAGLPANIFQFFDSDEEPVAVTTIHSIQFNGLTAAFDIRTTEEDADTTIATVGPNGGATRYRRFRLNRSTDGETTVHVLCKRAFRPLEDDDDICYVSNIGALKHGLLGRMAEDNADLERAEYHWQRCTKLLDEEAASAAGSALPRLSIDPFGTGGRSIMPNMY